MRSHPKVPAAASEPDHSFLTEWKSSPALVAARQACEAAEAKVKPLRAELDNAEKRVAELRQRAATGAQIGFDDFDAAETTARRAARELEWAETAATKADEALDAAAREAMLGAITATKAEFAEKQRQIFLAGFALVQANTAFFQFGQQVEKQLGPGLFPRWHIEALPVLNHEALARYGKSARWLAEVLPKEDAPPATRPGFVRVLVTKPGATGSVLQGNSPGEVCWVPRTELTSLISQRAIRPVKPGDFPMPREPLADALGDVVVRFKDWFEARLPSGAKKWWSAGDEAKINKDVALRAVLDGSAEYVAGE